MKINLLTTKHFDDNILSAKKGIKMKITNYRNEDERKRKCLEEMLKNEEVKVALCAKKARKGLKGMLVFAGLLIGGLVLSYFLPSIQGEEALNIAKISSIALATGGSVGGLGSAYLYYNNKNEGLLHKENISDIKKLLYCPKAEDIFEDDFAR